MLKKIIYPSVISIFLISPCYANDFYAGIGIAHQTANFAKTLSITTPDNSYNYYKRDHQPGTGILGNIFTGYEWNFNQFYLATELNAGLSSLKYHGFFTETVCRVKLTVNVLNICFMFFFLAGHGVV